MNTDKDTTEGDTVVRPRPGKRGGLVLSARGAVLRVALCAMLGVMSESASWARTGAATQGNTPPAAGEVVELELWTWALRPWFNAYMADLIADFESANPGVRVRWVDVPGDAIIRKYFAAGAAGKLPDVVNLPDKVFLRFANLGGLRALDDLLPGDPDGVYVAPALDQCRVATGGAGGPGGTEAAGAAGGSGTRKLFALPWYLSTEISVLNTALLAEGGLSAETVGTRWSALLEQAGPFRAKTGKHLFMLRLGDVDLLSMITAEGLDPIVPNPSGGGYKSNLLEPRVVALMERWAAAYHAGDLPRESVTADYPEMVQSFKEGRVALLNADAVRSVRSDAPRLYASLAVRPGITGSIGKTNVAVVQVGVGSQTKHPELAAKLAWHMTSAPWQERLCRQASRVPGTIASLGLPDFSRPEDTSDKLRLAMGIGSEQLREGRARSFIPPTGRWPELEKAFGDEIKRCLLEKRDVRQTLTRIEAKWNESLAAEAEMMRQGGAVSDAPTAR